VTEEVHEGPKIIAGLEELWNAYWALHKGRDWMVITNSAAGATVSMLAPKRIASRDLRDEAEARDFTGSAFPIFQHIIQRIDDVVHEHLTAEARRSARRG
jgi:hypothetical protein